MTAWGSTLYGVCMYVCMHSMAWIERRELVISKMCISCALSQVIHLEPSPVLVLQVQVNEFDGYVPLCFNVLLGINLTFLVLE